MLPNVQKWLKKMDKAKVSGLKLVFYLLTFKIVLKAALMQTWKLDLISRNQPSRWEPQAGTVGPGFPKLPPGMGSNSSHPWGSYKVLPAHMWLKAIIPTRFAGGKIVLGTASQAFAEF